LVTTSGFINSLMLVLLHCCLLWPQFVQPNGQRLPALRRGVRHKAFPVVGSLFNPFGANDSLIHTRDT